MRILSIWLQLSGLRWRRNFNPLVPFNLLWILMAVYFAGTRIASWEYMTKYEAIMATVFLLPSVFIGTLRAYGLLFGSDDWEWLQLQAIPTRTCLRIRWLQQFAWNLFCGVFMAVFYAGVMRGKDDPVLWRLIYCSPLHISITVTGLQLLIATRFAHVRAAVSSLRHGGPGWWRLCLNGIGIIGWPIVCLFWIPILTLILYVGVQKVWFVLLIEVFAASSMDWLALQYARHQFEDAHTAMRAFSGARRRWLWGWNEVMHGILPRDIRALVFRDLALILRGAFPRGLLVLAAALIPPIMMWMDLAYPEPADDSSLLLQFKLLAYALGSFVPVAYALGFDFLKRRSQYALIEMSQPVTPGTRWRAHGATVLLFLVPYVALFTLVVAAQAGSYPVLSVPALAGKFTLLAVLVALHATAEALASFDGRSIPGEGGFVISVAMLGLGGAVILPMAWYLVPVVCIMHSNRIQLGLRRMAAVEVTW